MTKILCLAVGFLAFCLSNVECQNTCSCAQLEQCLSTRRATRQLEKANCRQQCNSTLGTGIDETTRAAAVQCFQTFDANKQIVAEGIRTCIENTAGRPCSDSNFDVNDLDEEEPGFFRRGGRRGPHGFGPPPFDAGLPDVISDYHRCTRFCQFGNSRRGGPRSDRSRFQGRYGPRVKRHMGVRRDYEYCANEQRCQLIRPQGDHREAFCTCNQQSNFTNTCMQHKIDLCTCLRPLFPNQQFDCDAPRAFGRRLQEMCSNNGGSGSGNRPPGRRPF